MQKLYMKWMSFHIRITSYNVCYTKLLRIGIFSLNGRSTPTQIINFGNVISSIVLSDKNELFVSFANEPKVAHFPFLKQCIEDRSKWEIDEYPINAVGDFCLALMGDEGDVIFV